MNRLLILLIVFGCGARLQAKDVIRIATYNIQFFSTNVVHQGDRLQKLKQVVALLDADIIGLEEIADRAALELLFPPNEWQIVIDDASTDVQDLALVARKSSTTVKSNRFLFPGPENETFFPNRRDLLCVDLEVTEQHLPLSVVVQHAKSRLGGRQVTDPRREGAARAMVQMIKSQFEDKNFVLLGDFNDNPDDRSLNILETGDPDTMGGPEETDGPLLVNLMDKLVAEDRVSHGRTALDVVNGKINTIDPGSRNRNNVHRGDNTNTGDILFDQILFPVWMSERYVAGSAKVFDQPIALQGTGDNIASDHLPVLAEFDFSASPPDRPSGAGVAIVALLPNPVGQDEGHEEVTIGNPTDGAIDLNGFKLRDRAQHTFSLLGTVPARGQLVIVMTSNTMPLNNTGDEVALVDPSGQEKQRVVYTAAEARPGVTIRFQ